MINLKKLSRTALLIGGLLTTLASSGAAQAQDEENPRNADLLRLQEWVLIERSLDPQTARTALIQLETLRRDTSLEMSDAEFYLTVAGITGLADNGHSNTSLTPIYKSFGVAPLRAYWFADGLYITRAEEAHANLVGGRIAAVEGIGIQQMLDRIDPYHGGTRGFLKAYTALPFMLSLPLLEAMDVVTDGKLTLTVMKPDGEQLDVDFGSEDMSTSISRIWPWEQLVPGKEDETLTWVSVEPARQALWLSESDHRFQFKRLTDDVVYIQFRGNFSSETEEIGAFMESVTTDLEANPPHAIILDNRANIGGDLTLTADFSLSLPDRLQPGGKIYSLTGNATFSAGIYNALTPKAAAPKRTVVVGEIVGDRPAFWAERWKGFQLPQTGWYLNYSLQKHDVGKGCEDQDICHLAGRGPINIAVGEIKPDHEVPMMFADYRAGRDPVLEKALTLIGD